MKTRLPLESASLVQNYFRIHTNLSRGGTACLHSGTHEQMKCRNLATTDFLYRRIL
jgi:hypothetical protein